MNIVLTGLSPLTHTASFINGSWRTSSAVTPLDVYAPASGELIAQIPQVSAGETEAAIDAASAAFLRWRETTPRERAQIFTKVAELHNKYRDDLARIISLENGKPKKAAQGEVDYSRTFFETFAKEITQIEWTGAVPGDKSGNLRTRWEPVGVCGAITPWNFPLAMISRKAGAALAAGCTMVIKPAPETPLSALALCQLFVEAGLPDGVINVVVGPAEEIGGVLMRSNRVRKLSFTGSTEVGKLLIRQSADTVKKLTLELGGNAPFIVFNDADMDRALDVGVFCKFRNTGQACTVANRFLIEKDLYPEYINRFKERAEKLVISHGPDDDGDIGPLINSDGVKKVRELLEDAVANGAKIELGGIPAESDRYVKPTVVTGVTSKMRIFREEIFGPVASFIKFDGEEEAVSLANDTNYGLAAYLTGGDDKRLQRVATQLEFGMVGINNAVLNLSYTPFGGIKESGYGKEGGRWGIEEYLNLKFLAGPV